MERDNEDPSTLKPQFGDKCQKCHSSSENVDCQCPGPPVTAWEVAQVQLSSMDQLLKGASLLTHTKSNVSNVPESIVRLTPSSDTKTKECSSDKTKLSLSKVNIRNECLNFDKEAVNVGSSCSKDGSESNIFEIDFDCVDNTRVIVTNESSHKVAEKQFLQERTPVKEPRRSAVPGAPQKNVQKTTGDHSEYSARPPRHSCPYCSKTFRSNGKLNNHVFSHTGERPFSCKHCQKSFTSKFKLVRHLLIHSEERKFLCTVCERRFLRNDHLKNHYKVHDPRKVLFRCERNGCEKEYSSAMSQRKHEAWHRAQDGDLTCLLCRVKHETVADLLLHLRRHSGSRMLKSPADRKFRCHVCERHFLTRKDVTRHLVVHTGERDFLCQFCPQRFGRKDHLIRHIKKSHHPSSKKKGKAGKSKATDEEAGEEGDAAVEGGEDEEEGDDPDEDETEIGVEFDGADVASPDVSEHDLVIDEHMLLKDQSNAPSSDLDELDTGESVDKVPTDLEEIQTSELIMRDPSPCSLTTAILSDAPDATLPSQLMAPQPPMDLFFQSTDVNFESVTTCDMLSTAQTNPMDGKKDGDLFEGTSQSLMFAEPTFDDEEFKSSDFLLTPGETSSGELLRFLLQSDPAAPLPGFSQAFNNPPGPPNS